MNTNGIRLNATPIGVQPVALVNDTGLAFQDVTEKLHVDLSGAPQTMLATFYAKALDADLPKPILGDRFAKEIVDRIDYDWRRTAITPANSPSVTTRSAHFDNWARQFLAVNSDAVVLHLGCGLDARCLRLDPGPGVEWYDVDYPDVAQLRRQLYPARDHYHLIAASVTDPSWFAEIPRDRPTLMIGEGLTMYLTKEDGTALLRRVVEHAPSGELQFDAFNRLGIKSQWMNAVVRRSGATLYWGIDGPDDIVDEVPGVRLLARTSPFDDASFKDVAWYFRVMAAVMKPVPSLRYMAQYHRYAF
jgi:methyltransferase (TIGR00027 family)